MIARSRKTDDDKTMVVFFRIINVFLLLIGLYSGMYLMRMGYIINAKHHVEAFLYAPNKYLHYTFNNKAIELPEVTLSIPSNNYIELSNERSQFLYSFEHFVRGQKWSKDSKRDYVKAGLKTVNQKARVKVKLFGLNNDHYRHPYKWSFRVKSKTYLTDYQNSRLNLLQPNTRMYLTDILCSKIFSNLNYLSINQHPISLKINSFEPDLYLATDFFSKDLIVRNKQRDSYIFTFSKINHPSLKKIGKDDQLVLDSIRAMMVNNPLEIFNKTSLDLFNAMMFLSQNNHAALDDNLHFFYNKVENRVYPIPREIWFQKRLRFNSEEEMKIALKMFLEESLVLPGSSFTPLFKSYLLDNSRFLELVSSVSVAAVEIKKIFATPEWKELEDLIYSRYPEALFLCKNMYLNIDEVLKLNLPKTQKQPFVLQNYPIEQSIVLEKDLILNNQALIISSGVKIDLNGHNIIVRDGSWKAIGSKLKPIWITNSTTLRSSIVVVNARDTSYLDHIKIENVSNLQSGIWQLPSAITFYESDVYISNATFKNNLEGDDFLNVFRCSYFNFSHVDFVNTKADAIDSDFSKGVIRNCTFTNIGNDAIDGSGSGIVINGSKFSGVLDKVISAGEASIFTISNCEITKSDIVFVSKDGSFLTEINNLLTNNKLDYCVFNKKDEFGVGSLNSDQNITSYLYLIEPNSKIQFSGRAEDLKFTKDVKSKLYGKEYGKSSK